jgi:hypothetical protein
MKLLRAQLRALCAVLTLVAFFSTTLGANIALADDITPIKKDDPAPFTGLLVPEARYTKFLDAELEAEDLRGKIVIERKEHAAVENILQSSLEKATKPPPWYKTTEFNFWVGFVLGMAATAGAVYAGVKIVEATK